MLFFSELYHILNSGNNRQTAPRKKKNKKKHIFLVLQTQIFASAKLKRFFFFFSYSKYRVNRQNSSRYQMKQLFMNYEFTACKFNVFHFSHFKCLKVNFQNLNCKTNYEKRLIFIRLRLYNPIMLIKTMRYHP